MTSVLYLYVLALVCMLNGIRYQPSVRKLRPEVRLELMTTSTLLYLPTELFGLCWGHVKK